MSDRRSEQIRSGAAERAPEPDGLRLGPIPITVTGVLIVVALVLSLVYVAYAINVRDASQIPLLASSAAILGLVFKTFSIIGLIAT